MYTTPTKININNAYQTMLHMPKAQLSEEDSGFTQLVVWPGTQLGGNTPEQFEEWMKDQGFTVKHAEQVKTLSDKDEAGDDVPDTGEREDMFFYIKNEEVPQFAIWRLPLGMRWWEDVRQNEGEQSIYPDDILEKYPTIW